MIYRIFPALTLPLGILLGLPSNSAMAQDLVDHTRTNITPLERAETICMSRTTMALPNFAALPPDWRDPCLRVHQKWLESGEAAAAIKAEQAREEEQRQEREEHEQRLLDFVRDVAGMGDGK